eukprot:gene17138-biopygen786
MWCGTLSLEREIPHPCSHPPAEESSGALRRRRRRGASQSSWDYRAQFRRRWPVGDYMAGQAWSNTSFGNIGIRPFQRGRGSTIAMITDWPAPAKPGPGNSGDSEVPRRRPQGEQDTGAGVARAWRGL